MNDRFLSKLIPFVTRCVLFIGACTLLSFCGPAIWLFDLISHFRLQYVLLLLIGILILAIARRGKLVALSALFCLINILQIAPFYWTVKAQATTMQTLHLRILSSNINYSNRDFEPLLKCIKEENPDICAIEELNPQCENWLDEHLPEYGFRKAVPRPDPFGIGVYSKIPFTDATVKYFTAKIPSLCLEFNWNSKPTFLIATHPMPPLTPDLAALNTEQLAAISKEVRSHNGSAIVIGDLNATSWCSSFRLLEREGGLVDTRSGFGLQPSWLTGLPIFCLPIDHCLVTPDLVTVTRKIGPDVGSDHNPLYVELERPI